MTNVELRPATADDLPPVLALWRVAAAPSVTDDEEGVRALLDRDRGALIVAVAGGEIVGSIVAGWDGWRGHVYRLAVRPDHRRRGLGRALVGAAEQRLAALGARKVQGVVLADNREARDFWTAVGYPHDAAVVRHTRVLRS